MIRERTKAGLTFKKANGERLGAVPFGYRVAKDGVMLKPHQREQEILQLMRRLRRRHLPLRAIVEKLNAEGVPARGKRWHLTTVANLLRREAA